MRFLKNIKTLIVFAVIFMAGALPFPVFGQCNSNNIVVDFFQLRKPGGGTFSSTDNYVLNTPVTGEIWVRLKSNGGSTNSYSLFTFFNFSSLEKDANGNDEYKIITYENCLFFNSQVPLGQDFYITTVNWLWGQKVEIKDLILAWEVSINKPCPGKTAKNQCFIPNTIYQAAVPLYPNFTFTGPTCDSRTITFSNNTTGGTAPYTYTWNFGGAGSSTQSNPTQQTNPIFTYSQPGNYTVQLTATDSINTVTSFTKTVSIPYPISVIPTTTPSQINGSTGSITIDVTGGTAPYTFLWTYPNLSTSTNQNITNLSKGTYALRVTDTNNCTYDIDFTVHEILTPDFSFSQFNCNNRIQFTDLTAGGISSNYTYAWDFNNDGTIDSNLKNPVFDFNYLYLYPDFPVLTYQAKLTVSDGTISRTVLKEVTINPNFGIKVTIVPTRSGESTGNITVTEITGGLEPYSFYWTGVGENLPSTNKDIYNLSEGFYILTVTDSNGCTQQVEYYLDPASILTLNWNKVDVREINQKVAINWETYLNVEGGTYVIERSFKDIDDFQPIGELRSHSTSQNSARYSFTDDSYPIFEDLIYYRIVYTLDQEKSYSPIKLVRREPITSQKANWIVYPNPSRGETISLKLVNEEVPLGEKIQLQAVNGTGFFRAAQQPLDRGKTLKISELLGELPRGITYLRIQWQDQSETIKLIRTD